MSNETEALLRSKTSAARVYDRSADDFYAEPRGVAEAIFDVEGFRGVVIDPFCGTGRIVRAAHRRGYKALGFDKVSRWDRCPQHDPGTHELHINEFNPDKPMMAVPLDDDGQEQLVSIVSNPPYNRTLMWPALDACLATAPKVAFLLPATFWVSARSRKALAGRGLYRIYAINGRPSMPPNVYDEDAKFFVDPDGNVKPIANGKGDFVWAVFLSGYQGHPTVHWLTWKDHLELHSEAEDD